MLASFYNNGCFNGVNSSFPTQLCAKLLTLQDSTADSLPTPPHPSPATVDSTTQSSSEQLWEVIRFVRREKDIAETKRELAETENQRHRRLSEQLQRQLDETREQLKQVEAAAKTHSMTSTQHAEILAKVGVVRGRGF